MPPKSDPYATPAQKSIDALLLVFTILVMVFVFLTSKQKRDTSGAVDVLRQVQSQSEQLVRR